MNLRGIAVFLGLNYLLVFLLAFILLSEGALALRAPNVFQYLLLAAMMGIPALCALVALQFCPDEVSGMHPVWPVPWGPALRVTLLAPVVFAIIYGIATAAGLTSPQWNLAGLMNRVEGQMHQPLPADVAVVAPWFALVVYPVLSILLGATFYAFIALGSEIGWRGYLLPRLQPLGLIPAILISGICWGIWFLPFVYGWFHETGQDGQVGEAMLRVVALAIALGAVLGAIARRVRNLGVCALALGAVVGQASGIWVHLFPQSTPPWTGATGWIAIAVWAAVACVPWVYAPKTAGISAEKSPNSAPCRS